MALKTNKAKSKKIAPRSITPEDTKGALNLSFGEYIRTNQEATSQILDKLAPDLKVYQEMAQHINDQMKSWGVVDQIKKFQETYKNFLHNFDIPKFSGESFVALPVRGRELIPRRLSSEDIDAIAKRSAEIISEKIHAQTVTGKPAVMLVLTAEGDLYTKDDPAKRYSMRDAALRLKIVRTLLGKKGFFRSKELQAVVDCKSYASLTEAINAINRKANQFLALPADPHRLIISKPHSGYMINPLYPIITE